MYGKILIQSKLKVLTGLHIGGSSAFSAIGAVDSPVVSDPRTGKPIVPGSSLKGKLRTILARTKANNPAQLSGHNEDPAEILRLFGSSKKNAIRISRLQFADAFVCNSDDFTETGLTEVKFENTINRANLVANPRQIERVIPGVVFAVRIVYEMQNLNEVKEDLENLAQAMKLLQLDYLGGHGTRGSGRVSFEEITLEPISDSEENKKNMQTKIDPVASKFEEVTNYELLAI